MNATTQFERANVKAKKIMYWAISSRASSLRKVQRLGENRSCQAAAKSVNTHWVYDIVCSTSKDVEDRLKRMIRNAKDTNLRGASSSGLPQATHFFWYAWRNKIRTIGSNLASAANVGVSEQILRARQMSYAQFAFQSSTLMTVQLDELPDGVGANYINTTHTATTVFSPIVGVNDRRGKDVTVKYSRYVARAA